MNNLWIMLLAEAAGEIDYGEIILQYVFYFVIIVVGSFLLSFLKRRNRRELTAEKIKSVLQKTRKKANDVYKKIEKKGTIFASVQLLNIASAIENCAWYTGNLIEEKKDIAFESISATLDAAATAVAEKSEDAFISVEEEKKCLKEAIEKLDACIQKAEWIIALRSQRKKGERA